MFLDLSGNSNTKHTQLSLALCSGWHLGCSSTAQKRSKQKSFCLLNSEHTGDLCAHLHNSFLSVARKGPFTTQPQPLTMAGHKEVTHHFQHPFHPFLPESVALHYFCNHVAQPHQYNYIFVSKTKNYCFSILLQLTWKRSCSLSPFS